MVPRNIPGEGWSDFGNDAFEESEAYSWLEIEHRRMQLQLEVEREQERLFLLEQLEMLEEGQRKFRDDVQRVNKMIDRVLQKQRFYQFCALIVLFQVLLLLVVLTTPVVFAILNLRQWMEDIPLLVPLII